METLQPYKGVKRADDCRKDSNNKENVKSSSSQTYRHCKSCTRSLFNECSTDSSSSSSLFRKCDECQEESCKECTSVCSTCHITLCFHCVDDDDTTTNATGVGIILPCHSCGNNKKYCYQCRSVAMCHGDNCQQKYYCDQCLTMKRCGYCGGHFCNKCWTDVKTMSVEYVGGRDDDDVVDVDVGGGTIKEESDEAVNGSNSSSSTEPSVETFDICVKCQEKMMELL